MAESIKKEEETSGTPHQDNLTKDQVSRYSRQLILPQVGAEGKKKNIKYFAHFSKIDSSPPSFIFRVFYWKT